MLSIGKTFSNTILHILETHFGQKKGEKKCKGSLKPIHNKVCNTCPSKTYKYLQISMGNTFSFTIKAKHGKHCHFRKLEYQKKYNTIRNNLFLEIPIYHQNSHQPSFKFLNQLYFDSLVQPSYTNTNKS